MNNSSNIVWRLFWTLIHEWFCATCIHIYIVHMILTLRNNSERNHERTIDDVNNVSDDTLERLRNITKLFSAPINEDEEHQRLQKVEKFAPSEKIKNTFQKFEEISQSSNGHLEQDDDEEEIPSTNGVIRSTKKTKEHIPYHEMAEVKDKFEKGLVDVNKPRIEKRLDVRVQSGLTSSKKQAFEQGEFEQVTDSNKNKAQIEADIVAGLTSLNKQVFEQQQQQQMNNEMNKANKATLIEHDVLVGLATETKAKFENGNLIESLKVPSYSDEIATIVGTGLAQAKLTEFLSKIDAEQQNQRSAIRQIDIDPEQGIAIARREQFASMANSEFKSFDKQIDVTTGLASMIKEQYIADANKTAMSTSKAIVPDTDIESGLAKNRATAFEKPDENTIKRTVDIENELVERGVAKERVAMFKNWENGLLASSSRASFSGESKIRVDGFRWHVRTCEPLNGSTLKRKKHLNIRVEYSDTLITMSVRLMIKSTGMDTSIALITEVEENGNVVRESDKSEEIYFEKGQTRQLVEQWKTKQKSPDRDISSDNAKQETDGVQQGKAKNLVQMWKTIDKENSPPPERRGPRPMTPPIDGERHVTAHEDNEIITNPNASYTDDKASIESGLARAARERFLQNAEQSNTIQKRKTLKQITPPPESFDVNRRKSLTPPKDGLSMNEQYTTAEEIVSIKGQAKSLKNRFIELEEDARKVETAASKMRYVPKRFVATPAPKQFGNDSNAAKCFECNKTVYAMEKIEADKKIYHKSCFKCMHCKSVLKLGNYTANDGQIYCKPHFLQLFAIKGNYSIGLGLTDSKTRWSSSNSPNDISIDDSISSLEN